MIIPVRCFSCGSLIANKWKPYVAYLESNISEKEALDLVGCTRICCRRMLLSHVDIHEKLLKFGAECDPTNRGEGKY